MGWEEKFVPEYAKGQFAPLIKHWATIAIQISNTKEWVAQPKDGGHACQLSFQENKANEWSFKQTESLH